MAECPVSSLTPSQLVNFLTSVGITRTGLVSVWEKEVTGEMLREFCEEDIKDVFTEFKDRFRIRKLLRDIAEKGRHTSKPSTSLSVDPVLQRDEPTQDGLKHSHSPSLPLSSPKSETVSSPVFHSSSSSYRSNSSRNQLSNSEASSPTNPSYSPQSSPNLEDSRVKEEQDLFFAKRQCVEREQTCAKTIPEAHTTCVRQSTSHPGSSQPGSSHSGSSHLGSSQQSGSSAHSGSSQPSSMDVFVPPSAMSMFFSKTPFFPPFMNAHPILGSGYPADHRQMGRAESRAEEQALCLKKSPQRIVSPPQNRSEAASPATQPSSTTPDFLYTDPSHLDFTSIMSMGHLAAKFSAQEILSKKSQRSRPNSAQKLGSILIRNAAQQANLWTSPPHLRNISQPQKQKFLNSIYQIAPHIQEYENLLWQRLSETLQNRRKYLLDKKLGKRGVSGSGQSATSSSSALDFSDFSDWQVTSMQNRLNSGGDDLYDDVNILNDTAQSYMDTRPIKSEPPS